MIDLDEEDESILDAIWEEIRKEKHGSQTNR